MRRKKVLALGATALTAGTLLMSEIALADGNSHRAAHHARWHWWHGWPWWYANAGALNTNPYGYGSYGYGWGYGRLGWWR